jgi:hypothetical protein
MADLVPVPPTEPTPVVILSRGQRRVEPIDFLEGLSHLMDRAWEVPGSKARFGLNSLLLLMPGIGDAIASAISLMILFVGLHHYRVPRIVAVRMVMNTVLDAAISAIPIVGNLWDVWFKADTRNVRLLRQYAGSEQPPSTWGHWLIVISMLLLCLALLALAVVGAVAVAGALVRALQTPAA